MPDGLLFYTAQVDEAKQQGDPVALAISRLKLENNTITLRLEDSLQGVSDDEDEGSTDDDSEEEEEGQTSSAQPAPGEADADVSKGAESASDMGEDSDEEGSAAPPKAGKARKATKAKKQGQASAAPSKHMLVDVDLALSAFANARQVGSTGDYTANTALLSSSSHH